MIDFVNRINYTQDMFIYVSVLPAAEQKEQAYSAHLTAAPWRRRRAEWRAGAPRQSYRTFRRADRTCGGGGGNVML